MHTFAKFETDQREGGSVFIFRIIAHLLFKYDGIFFLYIM